MRARDDSRVSAAALFGLTLAGCSLGARAIHIGTEGRHTSHGGFMRCGESVSLCGVLSLESGYGKGVYHHGKPVVHGLWPETGHFGSSSCSHTGDPAVPQRLYDCFAQSGATRGKLLSFQRHEWEKHGRCAGTSGAEDYFTQVCALAAGPLQAMEDLKSQGVPLPNLVRAMEERGFPVFGADDHTQELQLSACAGPDGRWRLSQVKDFAQVCGSGGAASNSPAPEVAAPAPTQAMCVRSKRGPECGDDSSCAGLPGCLRCAHSGYCTAEP